MSLRDHGLIWLVLPFALLSACDGKLGVFPLPEYVDAAVDDAGVTDAGAPIDGGIEDGGTEAGAGGDR